MQRYNIFVLYCLLYLWHVFSVYSEYSSSFDCVETNETLKLKFRKLHEKVVSSVNPASIIDFLFQEEVIGPDDMRALLKFRDDPQQQSKELLALLHTSANPMAFVHLYLAIKRDTSLLWLVEDIDKFIDQSVTSLLQQLNISESTGYLCFTAENVHLTCLHDVKLNSFS